MSWWFVLAIAVVATNAMALGVLPISAALVLLALGLCLGRLLHLGREFWQSLKESGF